MPTFSAPFSTASSSADQAPFASCASRSSASATASRRISDWNRRFNRLPRRCATTSAVPPSALMPCSRMSSAGATCGAHPRQGLVPPDVRHSGADLRSPHATDHLIAIRCRAAAIKVAEFDPGTAHRRGVSKNCQSSIHSMPSPNTGLQNPVPAITASPACGASQAVLQFAQKISKFPCRRFGSHSPRRSRQSNFWISPSTKRHLKLVPGLICSVSRDRRIIHGEFCNAVVQKGLPRAPCRGLIHGNDSRRSRLG